MKLLKTFYKTDGYTFIEVFLVLLIVGLTSSILYTNSSTILGSLNRGTNNLKSSYDILNLRHTLSIESRNIKTPWFYKEHIIVLEEGSIKLYFYNGMQEEFIELMSSDSGTTVNVNDNTVYESKNISGIFSINNSVITFTSNAVKFNFLLGVILA